MAEPATKRNEATERRALKDRKRRTVPITIPDELPARDTLADERIIVMRSSDALRQDIRPLRIGLLNLMPDKIAAETQIARLLGATPLQVELTLVRITDHISRNTSADHMASFYRPWEDVRSDRFDGFIITGAPVERLPFEDVSYWDELSAIFDWTQTDVHRSFAICWAAQAALFHFHGLQKRELPAKALGVFDHEVLASRSTYLRGFADRFPMPVSRWTEIETDALEGCAAVDVLACSDTTGAGLVYDEPHQMLHMFNHLEYETATLAQEYARDGGEQMPENYFPGEDPSRRPLNSWRSSAHLLFANWIDEIYQTTPFDIDAIGAARAPEFVI